MRLAVEILGYIILAIIGLSIISIILKSIIRIPKFNLKGRWIVITGCDSGIGAGLVSKLTAKGARVIAYTFTEAGAKTAREAGAELTPCLDLTDFKAVEASCKEILSLSEGKIWGIVHNAGAVQPGFIEFQSIENYRSIMEINFFAIVDLMQQLIPAIKKSSGRISIVTSVDGIVSLPGNAPYDSAKFAAEAYADALRMELSFWNVHLSVINPSTMKTPLAMRFFESMRVAWDQQNKKDPDGEWKSHWTPEWLDEYIEINTRNLKMIAQDPQCAVKSLEHSLSAKHPKMRYLSGTLSKTLFYALWKMPEELTFRFKKGLIRPNPKQ